MNVDVDVRMPRGKTCKTIIYYIIIIQYAFDIYDLKMEYVQHIIEATLWHMVDEAQPPLAKWLASQRTYF